MTLANDNKRWPGTQTPSYSYDRNAKPIAQPPCDLPSQHQFEEITEYIEVPNDRWNNETPVDWTNHRDATAGMGMYGDRQFASNAQDVESTGYGKQTGLNIIEYDKSAAFNEAERTIVDVSRADRGRES
jgi:hypothetical protein